MTAPFDSGLPVALLRHLDHPATRVLLIRRPATRTEHRHLHPDRPARWFLVDVGGAIRTGTWTEPDDLLATVDDAPGVVHQGASLILVCTHGVHDTCCAVRGRPVAAAAATRWPDRTWECSHLGGDRFAANAVVFPEAICFGGISPVGFLDTVDGLDAGRLDPISLRGFVGQPPPVQTALAAVHATYGPAGVWDAVAEIVSADGPDTVVEVRGVDPLPERTLVTLHAVRRPAARLTCRAVRETSAISYEVRSLRTPT